ncbi:MAG: class I SAM-dependent methyltransferase [Leptospiraceae bacterium]|nr:class I SAM-dependent methyltransferase [Leptospiraceae bacterium]
MKIRKEDSYFKFSNFGFSKFANNSLIKIRKKVFDVFHNETNFTKDNKILDVGVSAQDHVSSNFFEQYYPFKTNLTALGLGDFKELESLYSGITYVKGDGKILPFKDSSFDWVFSHAVVEHVGNDENRISFIQELIRVSKKGVVLTTPNRCHPLEFHTGLPLLHFLPKKIHRKLYTLLGKDFYSNEENLNLFTSKELKKIALEAILNLNLQKSIFYFLKHIYWLGFPSNIILVIKRMNNENT